MPWAIFLAVGTEQGARALLEAEAGVPVVISAGDYDPVKAVIIVKASQR